MRGANWGVMLWVMVYLKSRLLGLLHCDAVALLLTAST